MQSRSALRVMDKPKGPAPPGLCLFQKGVGTAAKRDAAPGRQKDPEEAAQKPAQTLG